MWCKIGYMKKLLLTLGLLIAVGGGCVGALGDKFGGDKTVEGDWHLAFDLPDGWVMAVPYDEPDSEAIVPDQAIARDLNEVYLQSTDKAVIADGSTPDAAVSTDTYVTSGYTQIRVTQMDTRRVIPSEAEDLGDGFLKLDGDFYLKTESANYKFDIRGDDTDQAEDIILSAEVVNEFGLWEE